MIILSVDLGKARTGLAICDKSEMLATPLAQINEKNEDILLDKVANVALARQVELIIVGLPKNMDGTEGDSAKNARAFASKLKEKTGLLVRMQDERGTTITAHKYLNATNTRGKKRKNVVDSVAATIILQNFLDSKNR
ncbi:MAG: Holliday junction resolvase RuvX [Ruminococcus sp.]|jgi:putative Holliday junction resolvase|nr:Holliday junction resolvase RuvX [Ruminococcus sp.]